MNNTTIKLFIDDIRECPDGWIVARTIEEASILISENIANLEAVSFDFDCGESRRSFLDSARTLAKLIQENNVKLPKIYIHSSNPVGAKRIQDFFRDYFGAEVRRVAYHW